MTMITILRVWTICATVSLICGSDALAHNTTRDQAISELEAAPASIVPETQTCCSVSISLISEASNLPIHGTFRITNKETQDRWWPADWTSAPELRRVEDWWTIDGKATITLSPGNYRVEAIAGLDTLLTQKDFSVTKHSVALTLPIHSFHLDGMESWWAGNTHLHMLEVTRDFADRYLSIVPSADGLNVVYVSHLQRDGVDHTYVTNDMRPDDLAQFDTPTLSFGFGQETRHNFGTFGEGYGHILFLAIQDILPPVSIGAELSRMTHDYPPLKPTITSAKDHGASTIWAHNNFGMEDIPSWIAGLVDAQNLFDGGARTHYERSVYRYLDIGLKVPLSSGTDWFILDFARAYVYADALPNSDTWLEALKQGQSFITNGPLLQFEVDGKRPGDTIELCDRHRPLQVKISAAGRTDFVGLEVLYNGEIIHITQPEKVDGVYTVEDTFEFSPTSPGWLAVRTPWETQKNVFGETIRAHSSAIYFTQNGQKRFSVDTALGLISEMKFGMRRIESLGRFASDEDKQTVLKIYRDAIAELEARIEIARHQSRNETPDAP
ncbi:MAG: hypothetical protein Hens3KO_18130 [Henriciella sp.]